MYDCLQGVDKGYKKMNKKQKTDLIRILIAATLFVMFFIIEHIQTFEILCRPWLQFFFCLVPYFIVGYDVIKKSIFNIKNGQIFDENFLMMIATFGAFFVGEYLEAVAVMLFYQIGELFQSVAVGKSRQSIAALMEICPEYVNIEVDEGIQEVDPDDVEVGSHIIIKPGERIPLDGIVIEGESFLDTSALTGESVPRKIVSGDDVISGCINGNGTLRVRTTKEFEDSTVSKVLELVENATNKKAKVEKFITRFAKYYTPFVTIAAVILAVFPPILFQENWMIWLERACTFLVVSCPCALVISVPMGFFGGIGAASKEGVLVKGSNYLELLSEMDVIAFDKTGTLTNGVFQVTKIIPAKEEYNKQILFYAACVESFSSHPIAQSIVKAFDGKAQNATDVTEVVGRGIYGRVDQKEVLVGNALFFKEKDFYYEEYSGPETVVYVSLDGEFLGAIIISDVVKEDAKVAIEEMKKLGIKKTIMLTGDRKEIALSVANKLGIDAVFYELLPADKVLKMEEVLVTSTKNHRTAFVGDGMNDAPVLARADIGIAMGSLGSDAAIEAADIVIMDDDIRKIIKVMKISKKTMRIVKENIIFALGVKGMVLILGAIGITSMWAAVFADVGVAAIAILNSMRMIFKR